MSDNGNGAVDRWDIWLGAAHKIALQTHGPAAARQAVIDAISWIDTAANTANRTENDRELNNRTPIAPAMEGPRLLQRLLYKASDLIAHAEGECEASRPQNQLLARYLQYIMLFCLRRPSRWTAVAISQLVYSYNGAIVDDLVKPFTREAWDLSERKRAKRRLIVALNKRFPTLSVNLEKGGIGRTDRHFKPWENQEPFAELLPHWLKLFTPWNTDHVLTSGADLGSLPPELRDLASLGVVHIFVDPICFSILLSIQDYPEPAIMMRLPKIGKGKVYGD